MVIPEASEREELTVQDMIENKDSIVYPITPKAVIKNYPQYLTDFEQTEILEYEEVFYLTGNDNKYNASKAERLINNGFDDNDGYYRLQKGDQLGYRFQIIEQIGKGAFG